MIGQGLAEKAFRAGFKLPTPWASAELASRLQIEQEELNRAVALLAEAERIHNDGPCRCAAVAWTPHKHRYEITTGGLR